MSIQINDVSFDYETVSSLNHINLTISPGECLVLCGKSGCGKTTVTRLINGLIPELYEGKLEGQVVINDLVTAETPIYTLAEIVASVFQNPKTQFFTVDVESELAFACENSGLATATIIERMADVAQLFGITHLLPRKMFDLSGGEKQLVAFASAYMIQPEILVLDEPSSNLDLVTIEKIKHILLKVKERGTTIIIAEHRLYYLKELADRFALITEGVLSTIYSKEAFLALSEPELKALGLRTLDLAKLDHQPLDSPSDSLQETLTLQSLNVSYPKSQVSALDLDNITFKSGDVIGILGRNGAGKTTLARTLSGLQKKITGAIYLNGHTNLSRKERINLSYLVMQDVNYQLFCETVKKELLLKAGKPELFDDVVTAFSLENILARHPMSLSGGQKQRVAIATAVLSGKKIIILDEPTSGLDYYHMQQVSQIVAHLRDLNVFVFIISHDLEFIQSTCTTILTLEEGKKKLELPLNKKTAKELLTLFNELSQ